MRKYKDFKRLESVKSARLIVIAAEGRKTENIYFEAMKATLCASDVQMELLKRETDDSSPENVLNQIIDFKAEYKIEDDDQLWVVVDKDKWTNKMLAEVARYCAKDKHLYFCLSNPCFELWLLLHLDDVASYNEEQLKRLQENQKQKRNGNTWLKCKMKEKLGKYSESKYDAFCLLDTIDIAIERAQQLDTQPKSRWPKNIGTRVYRLVQNIMNEQRKEW